MFDLYLFNTIINVIWYIFTILFVLYKFTSFFTYIYGFVKFCTKTVGWITWGVDKVKLFIDQQTGYSNSDIDTDTDTDTDEEPIQTKPTIMQNLKKKARIVWYYAFGKPKKQNTYYDIPLYETQHSTYLNRSLKLTNSDYSKDNEQQFLQQYLNNLEQTTCDIPFKPPNVITVETPVYSEKPFSIFPHNSQCTIDLESDSIR